MSMFMSMSPSRTLGEPVRVARDSRRPRQQRTEPDQVVGRGGEGDDPIHEESAAVPQLAQAADRFHPAKDLLDQFPFSLADGVALMAGGTAHHPPAPHPLRPLPRYAQCPPP